MLPEFVDYAIIDMHVHIGHWVTTPYCNYTLDNIGVYWSKSRNFINNALFMPAEDKNNVVLHKQLVTNPRSYMLYWYDPYRPNSTLTLDSLTTNKNNKIMGIKFHPEVDRIQYGLSSPEYTRGIIDIERTHNLPILVHCGSSEKTSHISYLVHAAKRFSTVMFIAAHMGGNTIQQKIEAINMVKAHDNIFMDTSATKDTYAIKHALSVIGPERILFGSDWPVMDPLSAAAVIFAATKDTGTSREKILAGNAKKLFGIGV